MASTGDLTRRHFLAGAGAAGFGLVLGACGADEPERPRATSAADRGGTFPATVAHRYGSTTIEREPRRVACWGGSDVDMLLALGIKPVLIPQIVPRWKTGVGPWATSRLGTARPVVVGGDGEVDFERIAASRPDVITLVESDVKGNDYRKLSKLAPTVAPPKGFADYTVPWDHLGTQVGAAVGRKPQAEKIIAATRARFAAARDKHPGFEGKTAVLIDPAPDGGVYTFATNDVRTRFLGDLGLGQPPAIKDLFHSTFYTQISAERLDLLDSADLLVVASTSPDASKKLAATPTFRRLELVRRKRMVAITDRDVADAMTYSTVLSIPFQLDHLVPRLATALAV